MNCRRYLSFILIVVLFLSGCSNTDGSRKIENSSEIANSWSVGIDADGFVGKDTLTLLSNGNYVEKQTVHYSNQDNGFSFSVPVSIKMEGKWNFRSDSLYLVPDKTSLIVAIDKEAIQIKAVGEKVNLSTLKTVEALMKDDLCIYIDNYYKNEFLRYGDSKVALGYVSLTSEGDLLIRSDNGVVVMTPTSRF